MKIKISDTLSLPANVATQKLAFIGRTGSGKTYGVGKLVEGMLDDGIQVVILDPVGVWYGLRLLADGKSPGFPIAVLGGLKGDVPLEPTGGVLVADMITESGNSVVLDVSQFESDADKARFAKDFADRFFFRKKAAPSPVHLVIEECQEFVPQNPQKGEERMLHAFQRMWKLGRNFGIGGTLVSQRPQEVSKKALNQTEALFAFQMTGPQERKAIELWMSEKGIDSEIAGLLPGLKVGHCFVWSPQWLQVNEQIAIATKKTFNSSSTPDQLQRTKQDLAPIDLSALKEKMAATIERAKAYDPKELRAEITRLKRQQAQAPVAKEIRVEVPVLSDEHINTIRAGIGQIGLMLGEIAKFDSQVSALKNTFNDLAGRVAIKGAPAARAVMQARSSAPKPTVVKTERYHPEGSDGPNDLSKADRRVLTCLAQHPDGCDKGKLALLAGYTYSGGFRNILSALRTSGFITGGNEEVMVITEVGLSALGSYDELPTGSALAEWWLTSSRLSGRERKVLEILLRHTGGITAEELAMKSGYEYSGGFRNILSALRTAGVMTGKNTDTLNASDTLRD